METSLQLRSLVKSSGELELSLAQVPVPQPGADEVLVRIEAAPINPSDLGLLLGPADIANAKVSGSGADAVVTAPVPQHFLGALKARLDASMPVGNEGAGVVVAAGDSPQAKALLGKTVAILGGATYAQHRIAKASDVLELPAGATAADGASCFVNPLTALSMTEVMRREGHTALVHTAAASNLGQMLNKICIADGISLVNIVRSAEQAKILKDLGAKYVIDSTAPDFIAALTDAIEETGATLAFDAIGGGKLASQILSAMEVAANRKATEYSRYGSSTYKQVYIYGALDTGPTELARNFGLSWGVNGWLLTPFLMKLGADAAKLRARVAAELKTTFASHYTAEISLAEVLQPDIIAAYARKATGEKYLINPNKGV
ncbi:MULTISPECIES: zinc-binding dehydrogenase [unclassified Phenylobacterium]|uniref:zinc-binding dehydrogenase n=1 Tax=unclassified Phenylobacterium TaxID=2640670 RepID=UPI0022B2B8E7|nr:zinc-binding dehydrogenase [Phenylobacterium sp. NIBR 498073]WGU40872.1 zinc-binding dehydrogenase [Phenylobacterium sp. NIBR 498073]